MVVREQQGADFNSIIEAGVKLVEAELRKNYASLDFPFGDDEDGFECYKLVYVQVMSRDMQSIVRGIENSTLWRL